LNFTFTGKTENITFYRSERKDNCGMYGVPKAKSPVYEEQTFIKATIRSSSPDI